MANTNIVDKNGSLKCLVFKDIENDETYSIIATRSTYKGSNPWRDSRWLAIDTVKRLSDGATREMTRERMQKRFTNIKKGTIEWE